MAKYIAVGMVLLIGVLVASCERVHVLRANDAIGLDATRVGDSLNVWGAVVHSGLGVSSITTEYSGERMVIRAYLSPAGSSARREFAASIPIRTNVTEVWFGDPPNILTCCRIAGRSIHLPYPSRSGTGVVIWRPE